MDYSDLTPKQQNEFTRYFEGLNDGMTIVVSDEVRDFIFSKYPDAKKLESLKRLNVERQEELDALKAHYKETQQRIADRFSLTIEEVEEINDKFHKHIWTARFPVFNLIVAYWKIKRMFR